MHISEILPHTKALILITCLVQGACSRLTAPPEMAPLEPADTIIVHLYTRPLPPAKVRSITQSLSRSGYVVRLNDRELPQQLDSSTILHSISNRSAWQVSQLRDYLNSIGFAPVDLALTMGDHHYTRNHIGVYLFE